MMYHMNLLPLEILNLICSFLNRYDVIMLKLSHMISIETSYHMDDSFAIYYAKQGNLSCLKFVHEHQCKLSHQILIQAAIHGHLHIMKYAHQHNCPWHERICEAAALFGHLACLQYAHENGCAMPKHIYDCVMLDDHLHCLKYVLQCRHDVHRIHIHQYDESSKCVQYLKRKKLIF